MKRGYVKIGKGGNTTVTVLIMYIYIRKYNVKFIEVSCYVFTNMTEIQMDVFLKL